MNPAKKKTKRPWQTNASRSGAPSPPHVHCPAGSHGEGGQPPTSRDAGMGTPVDLEAGRRRMVAFFLSFLGALRRKHRTYDLAVAIL